MNINELIDEGIVAEDALKFESPSFNSAIIGVDYFGRLIYDYNEMVIDLMETENMTEDEAVEFIDYNTFRNVLLFVIYSLGIIICNMLGNIL